MDSQKDYYAVLGVELTAGKGRLYDAWSKLVEHHHTDRWVAYGPDRAREAARRTQETNEAWQVMSDDQRRLEYDRLRTSTCYNWCAGAPHPAVPEQVLLSKR